MNGPTMLPLPPMMMQMKKKVLVQMN